MMMIAMLALPFAMQAQTKFHDVEANGAKGPVKSISTSMMGMTRTIEFTEDGQMKSSEISNVVYDENGYLQSATMSMQGQSTDVKYTWEDGRVKSQTTTKMVLLHPKQLIWVVRKWNLRILTMNLMTMGTGSAERLA